VTRSVDNSLALNRLTAPNAWYDSNGKPPPFIGYMTLPNNGAVAQSADGAAMNFNSLLNGNPYFQGTLANNGAPPTGYFPQQGIISSRYGNRNAPAEGRAVLHFFNPATARPALPTLGQAARDDTKTATDRYEVTQDKLKMPVNANARANPQNPGAAAPG